VGQDRKLLGHVKSRKLKYFGRTTQYSSLEKDIMLSTMAVKQEAGWIQETMVKWTGKSLVEAVRHAEDRERYRWFIREVAYARTLHTANSDVWFML